MDDLFWRLIWAAGAVALTALTAFLFFGSILYVPPEDPPILVTDYIGSGTHRLTGIVPVPSECHILSVEVKEVGSFRYHINFTSWLDPARVRCSKDDGYQTFDAIVFAPALGAHFTATLDEQPLTMKIVKVYPKD